MCQVLEALALVLALATTRSEVFAPAGLMLHVRSHMRSHAMSHEMSCTK